MIIPDLYEKIGAVLTEMQPRVGESTFRTSELVDLYIENYPGDVELMKKRQKEEAGSHGLRGYLNGMVYEYAKNTDGCDPEKPAIVFVSEKTYRFVSH
jgi:hypothetical protein